jgi:hypothetical protein
MCSLSQEGLGEQKKHSPWGELGDNVRLLPTSAGADLGKVIR